MPGTDQSGSTAGATGAGWSFGGAWDESNYLNYGECSVVFSLPAHHPLFGRGSVSAGAHLRSDGDEEIAITFSQRGIRKRYNSAEALIAALPSLASEWDLPLLEPYWFPVSYRE